MADLLDHFLPTAGTPGFPPKIAIHTFGYVLVDYAYGKTNQNQMEVFWNLTDPAEISELSAILNTVSSAGNIAAKDRKAREWEAVLGITETGAKYQTKAAIRARMGI